MSASVSVTACFRSSNADTGKYPPVSTIVKGVKRSIRVTAEEAEALIIDATEQPIQRPSRKQRCWYSGKKKGHRIKTEIIVTAKGCIVSVFPGSR